MHDKMSGLAEKMPPAHSIHKQPIATSYYFHKKKHQLLGICAPNGLPFLCRKMKEKELVQKGYRHMKEIKGFIDCINRYNCDIVLFFSYHEKMNCFSCCLIELLI